MKLDLDKNPIEGLEFISGVSRQGEPFVHVFLRLQGAASVPIAQMTPEEMRATSHIGLEAAEAALSDAAVFDLLKKVFHVDDNMAGQFIRALRDHRKDSKEQ